MYNAYAHTFKCRHNISRHRGFHLKGIKNEVGVRYPYADPLVDMLCEGHGYKLELEDTMAGAVDNNNHSIVSEKSKADYVCWIITQGKELPVAVVVLEAKHITTINKNGTAQVLGYYCRSKGIHDNKTGVAILFNEYQDTVQVRFFLFPYQKISKDIVSNHCFHCINANMSNSCMEVSLICSIYFVRQLHNHCLL